MSAIVLVLLLHHSAHDEPVKASVRRREQPPQVQPAPSAILDLPAVPGEPGKFPTRRASRSAPRRPREASEAPHKAVWVDLRMLVEPIYLDTIAHRGDRPPAPNTDQRPRVAPPLPPRAPDPHLGVSAPRPRRLLTLETQPVHPRIVARRQASGASGPRCLAGRRGAGAAGAASGGAKGGAGPGRCVRTGRSGRQGRRGTPPGRSVLSTGYVLIDDELSRAPLHGDCSAEPLLPEAPGSAGPAIGDRDSAVTAMLADSR